MLRGDMSLVGPRPEREIFAAEFHERIPRYLERYRGRAAETAATSEPRHRRGGE